MGLLPLRAPGAPAPAPRPGATCPFARGIPPELRELFRVLRLARETKGALRPADILGRDLTAFEVAALDVFVIEQGAVAASDAALWRAESQPKK